MVFETGEQYDAVNDAPDNDVYRRDMTTAAGFTLASARNGLDTAGNAGGIRPAISADGSRVSFTSTSTDLTTDDSNPAVADVYTRDIGDQGHRAREHRVRRRHAERHRQRSSAIGGSGSLVAFVALDGAAPTTRLVPSDTNAQPDVLAKELAPTDTTGPATQITSTTPVAGGSAVAVAATDPSGVGSVIANGVALRPGAGATFSGTTTIAHNGPLKVEARDGSGNASNAWSWSPPRGPAACRPRSRPPRSPSSAPSS